MRQRERRPLASRMGGLKSKALQPGLLAWKAAGFQHKGKTRPSCRISPSQKQQKKEGNTPEGLKRDSRSRNNASREEGGTACAG